MEDNWLMKRVAELQNELAGVRARQEVAPTQEQLREIEQRTDGRIDRLDARMARSEEKISAMGQQLKAVHSELRSGMKALRDEQRESLSQNAETVAKHVAAAIISTTEDSRRARKRWAVGIGVPATAGVLAISEPGRALIALIVSIGQAVLSAPGRGT